MSKEALSGDLDALDRKILSIITNEGRISITALANKVGLSTSPCQVRLKRLIENGYVLGFHAQLNLKKLGLEHVAFVEVKLEATNENALEAFNRAVRQIAEVEQCHMIAAHYDYLLKVRTPDIATYRKVLAEDISALPGVASTSTFVSIEAVKDEPSGSQQTT